MNVSDRTLPLLSIKIHFYSSIFAQKSLFSGKLPHANELNRMKPNNKANFFISKHLLLHIFFYILYEPISFNAVTNFRKLALSDAASTFSLFVDSCELLTTLLRCFNKFVIASGIIIAVSKKSLRLSRLNVMRI